MQTCIGEQLKVFRQMLLFAVFHKCSSVFCFTNNEAENYILFSFLFTTLQNVTQKRITELVEGKGQVFNICQEREATGRVFPSGPGAGAVVTAACLPEPPVCSNVWSQELPRSLEKKRAELHLPGLVDSWKQNSQVSSELAPILRSCLESKHHENHSGNRSGNRVENLDMCHGHSLQSCVLWIRYMIPRHLKKLFWKWYISPTNKSLAAAVRSFS